MSDPIPPPLPVKDDVLPVAKKKGVLARFRSFWPGKKKAAAPDAKAKSAPPEVDWSKLGPPATSVLSPEHAAQKKATPPPFLKVPEAEKPAPPKPVISAQPPPVVMSPEHAVQKNAAPIPPQADKTVEKPLPKAIPVPPPPPVSKPPAPSSSIPELSATVPMTFKKPEPPALIPPKPASEPPPPPAPVAKTPPPPVPTLNLAETALLTPPTKEAEPALGLPGIGEPIVKTDSTVPAAVTGKPGGIKRVELDTTRRKKQPRVVLPPPEEAPKKKLKFSLPAINLKLPKEVLWGLAALVLVTLGIVIYLVTRETSVVAEVQFSELQPSGDAAVVYNFYGKLDLLKSDYSKRLQPVNAQIDEVNTSLTAAKADMAGRLEKKRLLQEEIAKHQAEIPAYVEASQKSIDDLCKQQGDALDKEYSGTLEQLQQEIENRAKSLGLKYVRNRDIDDPEVAVNAYKLSLYGAKAGVKVDDERAYGESLLTRWRAYLKTWQQKQSDIKDKALALKKEPAPKIDEAKARIEAARGELAGLDSDLDSLKDEIDRYEQNLAQLNAQANAITRQFVSDLLLVPKEYVKARFPVGPEGKIEIRNLQDRKDDFPVGGNYILFVAATQGDETFWTMKDFSIKEHERTQLSIERKDFVPARSFLK